MILSKNKFNWWETDTWNSWYAVLILNTGKFFAWFGTFHIYWLKFLLSLLENTPGILEVETRVGAKHPIMYRKVYPRMTWSKMSIAQSILRKLPDGLGRTLLVVWPQIAILVLCVSFLHWKRRIAVSLEWCWYKLEGIFLSFLAESRMGVQQSKTTANN